MDGADRSVLRRLQMQDGWKSKDACVLVREKGPWQRTRKRNGVTSLRPLLSLAFGGKDVDQLQI